LPLPWSVLSRRRLKSRLRGGRPLRDTLDEANSRQPRQRCCAALVESNARDPESRYASHDPRVLGRNRGGQCGRRCIADADVNASRRHPVRTCRRRRCGAEHRDDTCKRNEGLAPQPSEARYSSARTMKWVVWPIF
jgi:hypothetical protein